MCTKNWRQDTTQSAEIRITQNSSLLYHHPRITNDDSDDFNFLITQLRLVGTHRGTGRSTNNHRITVCVKLPLCTSFDVLEVSFYDGSVGWLKVTIQLWKGHTDPGFALWKARGDRIPGTLEVSSCCVPLPDSQQRPGPLAASVGKPGTWAFWDLGKEGPLKRI